MSDKNYVPASGESFQVKKMPGGDHCVQGSGKATQVHIDANTERVDHQTQRVLWNRSEVSRRLLWIFESKGKRVLSWPGGSIELEASDMAPSAGGGAGRLKPLKLTMPGKVVVVKVKEGDVVQPEQGLIIVEAMKMENLLLAPAKSRIAKIHVNAGDRLESGTILITFESAD